MSKMYIIDRSSTEYIKKMESMNSFFLNSDYTPMTLKQIINLLQIKNDDVKLLEKIINELLENKVIFEDDSKRFVVIDNINFVYCKYKNKSRKFGFGITGNGDDIYIDSKLSKNAMENDDIVVRITKSKSESKSREGKVVKIINHNITNVIGQFCKSNKFGFVVPMDRNIDDIYIPKKYMKNVKDGSLVEVLIEKFKTSTSKAEGKIVSVIDNKKVENLEVLAMIKSYNLDIEQKFNELVNKELETIPNKVEKDEFNNRIDRTKEKIVTIDGEDAKDLDDAISVKKLESGEFMLSVYIADVSHYVKSGSYIDDEAIKRGTSIYIPGQVIPMLPRKLSNGICSLNEGVDRLALAIDIKIDKTGRVINENIFKAIINVKKRMTYNDVQKVLNGNIVDGYEDYVKNLNIMLELSKLLKSKRIETGSINFDIPETKVIVDENYNVIDIKPYEKTDANDIIEEFMLITNMVVAKKFFFLKTPFIYRIHEKPDEEKIRDLNEFLNNYKIRIKAIKNVQPKTLSTLLEKFENDETKKVVSTLMLRALKLAKYSDECLGHFGLAAKYYCHFTSPIRRYPDLFIHRVISDYIENNNILPNEEVYQKQALIYSMSSSEAEKNATQIERDFDDLYKVIYMKKFIGEEYIGTVSSVTSFGMFVTLDNTIEGMVPFSNFPDDDYYEYDEQRKILIGRKTGKVFKLGDKVKVKLVKADSFLKEIDFKVVDN